MKTGYSSVHEWCSVAHDTHPAEYLMSKLHYHNSYEMFIMINGSTTMLVDDKLVPADKRDIIFLKPNILHKNNGGAIHERYALHFTMNYLNTYFTDTAINSIIQNFDKDKLTFTSSAFAGIHELLKKIEHNEKYAYLYIAEIMSIVENKKNIVQEKINRNNSTVNSILEYIHSNYADISGLDDIANEIHITKQYMCQLFKKHTLVTVSDYLNNVRINNACEMLRSSDMNVTETAMQCGYNSPMYFCKIFKKIVHMTPNEYKKHIEN
ncbi:MAG: AraC family transcriptional regulator [Clostridia bacterium]|nr:AraC family transcriptional regulator [Clostridia bacterium]